MATNLPTVSVPDPVAQYLLTQIFGTTSNYKAWLVDQIRARIIDKEMTEARQAAQAQVAARRAELETLLGGIDVS